MKIIRRIAIASGIIVILLISAALILPQVYKSDIIEFVRSELNKNIDATVHFDDDVSVSLLPNFPHLTIGVSDLSIAGKGLFEGDTLASANNVAVSVELMEFLRNNNAVITGVRMSQPTVYMTYSGDEANWDIFADDTTESSISTGVAFNKVVIEDGQFEYLDTAGKVHVHVGKLNGILSGDFNQNVFDAVSTFDAADVLVSYENIPYVNHLPIRGDATILVDLENDKYQFSDNQLYTNDLLITGKGGFRFLNETDMEYDIEFETPNASFKNLLSLVPMIYLEDVPEFKANGNASLSGYFKGLYSETQFPAYGINLGIDKGDLTYNSVKNKIDQINLDFSLDCPDGNFNSTVINLPKIHFELDDEPFDAYCTLKTLEANPYVDGGIKGKINLTALKDILPTEPQRSMSGLVNSELSVKGYPQQLNINSLQASGLFHCENVLYNGPEVPQQLSIPNATVRVDNNDLIIPSMQAKAGNSDVLFSAKFLNIWNYLFGKGRTNGTMSLISSNLDVGDFMTIADEADESDTEFTLDIPDGIELAVSTQLKNLKYGEEIFKNISGAAELKDKTFTINSLSTEFGDGFLKVDGSVDLKDPKNLLTDINLTAEKFQIHTIFERFESVRILAPVARWASGQFSTTLHFNAPFSGDFSPILEKLSCAGFIDVFNCDLKGLNTLNTLGEKLKAEQFKKPIHLDDLLLSFSIKDGKVYVEPFNIPVGESSLNLGGYTALDQTISLKGLLTVPKKLYEKNANTYMSYIPDDQKKLLGQTDITDLLLNLNIGGTVTKPSINITYNNLRKNVGDQVKDKVNDELEKRKREAEERAKQELDKAKAEADKAKKEAEEAAKKAVEEERKKVEERIKKEKEELKKKLEEELKKKKGGIFGK